MTGNIDALEGDSPVLMLPPGPDGKAYPDFRVNGDTAWADNRIIFGYAPGDTHCTFNVIAAAAIAFWWDMVAHYCDTDHHIFGLWGEIGRTVSNDEWNKRKNFRDFAHKQYKIWREIALGSRAYDNARIVEYKE